MIGNPDEPSRLFVADKYMIYDEYQFQGIFVKQSKWKMCHGSTAAP